MLKIAVCIKPVPESDKVNIDPKTKLVRRDQCESIINPLDRHALELAEQIRQFYNCEITIITMAPPFARKQLRKALSRGGDKAILLSDRAFGGGDSYATSYVLAQAIKKLGGFDLIITGDSSADAGTMHVPPQLAEWLGIDHLHNVSSLDIRMSGICVETEGNHSHMCWEAQYPLLISVNQNVSMPRPAGTTQTIEARSKELTVLSLKDFPDMDTTKIGLSGSPTQFGSITAIEHSKQCRVIDGNSVEQAAEILRILKASGINA